MLSHTIWFRRAPWYSALVKCAEQVGAWKCMGTSRCVSPVVGTSSLVEPISFGFACLGLAVFFARYVSNSWFVVSARCVYDQLNFHKCITCFGTFSMSRSRVEVPLHVGPHIRVHRWEFRCASTSSTSLSARLGSRRSRCPRGKSARTFPLHCTISHIASDHTCGEVCNMVACGRYGRQ